MDLRFPAPSSDNAIPLDGSDSGTVPVSPKSPGFHAAFRRAAAGATVTSVAPVYNPLTPPVDGDPTPPPQVTVPASDTQTGTVPVQSPENGAKPSDSATTPPGSLPSAPRQAAAPKAPRLRPQRRQRTRLRHLLPAWSVSLLVHIVILSALAAATLSSQDKDKKAVSFDSALAGYRQGEREELNVWADPANIPREEAVGKEHGGATAPEMVEMTGEGAEGDTGDGGGLVVAAAFGSGAPSTTPRFRGTGKGGINEGNSLPNIKVEGMHESPLNLLPAAPAADLYGGNQIAGDPTFDVQGIGPALDQLAREILRHLKDHKLTVVWLFDESESMQDDQRSILEKFDRVSTELKKNIDPGKKTAGALNHAIIGFGHDFDVILKKPTLDIDEISRSIKHLRTDMTGVENTMQAITHAVETYAGIIGKDRKMLLVLVTDESGDDGSYVEEARQALKKYKVPLYVIGRQSLFGYPFAHHRYVDPVTKDVYHPVINRGPETADFECFQWDGL